MKKLQGKIPLFLSTIFFIVIILLGYLKIDQWSGEMRIAGVMVLVVYLLWILLEGKVATSETKKQTTRKDQGTLEFYVLGRISVLLSGLLIPTYWSDFFWPIALGFILFLGGIGFRLSAIRTLGQFYSHRVRINEDHQVIDRGPYRMVRHPAYTGMILAHLGYVLVFFNWVSLGLYLFFFIPAIIYRILVEEKVLFRIQGYLEYAQDKKRVIPFLW